MRNLNKALIPAVLVANEATWLAELAADPANQTKKTRYRHPEVKAAVVDEAYNKCIYCESKVGHNTPGDVEHLKPSSKNPNLRFRWENLSLACNECNRRKSDYDDDVTPFLNPFVHDVESKVIHYGPIVSWRVGDQSAEITIRKLELHNHKRLALILRKIEKIHEVDQAIERYNSTSNAVLRELIYLELIEMAEPPSEFSGMVRSILLANGIH